MAAATRTGTQKTVKGARNGQVYTIGLTKFEMEYAISGLTDLFGDEHCLCLLSCSEKDALFALYTVMKWRVEGRK